MSEFTLTILSVYHDDILACALIREPFKNDSIHKYLKHVFIDIMTKNLITKASERLICIILTLSTARFCMITVTKAPLAIKQISYKTIKKLVKHRLKIYMTPVYHVEFDELKPIGYRKESQKTLDGFKHIKGIYREYIRKNKNLPITFVSIDK